MFTQVNENFEITFNIRTLDELNDQNGTADLLVVVLSHTETQEISTKNGVTNLKKLQVTDSSMKVVTFTVWGELTEQFASIREELDNKCILLINNAI